jgi:AcrR family transcriptional regulator
LRIRATSPRAVNPQNHAARRDEFVDAGQRLIQTRGYEQFSIEELLAEVGASKGAFYHYFDSKDALLEAIVDRFVELAVAERDREVAEVRSAVPLTDADVERLREALSRATKKNVEVKVVIDPEVLGGIVTRMGDLVIDGSVRHRLDQLREQI